MADIENKRINQKKYEILNEKEKSELKSKVFKTTIGVLPSRKTNEIEDLRIILKGKLIQEKNCIDNLKKRNIEKNTSNEIEPLKTKTYPEEVNSISYKKNDCPPAILSKCGTTDIIKLSTRPKIKKRSEYSKEIKNIIDLSDKIKSDKSIELIVSSNPELDYVKTLVKEANELSKPENKKISYDFQKLTLPIEKRIYKQNDSKNNLITNNNDIGGKNLLKSVEDLILNIKSGNLIREQEMSDERIKSILNRVIEKQEQKDQNFEENNENNNILFEYEFEETDELKYDMKNKDTKEKTIIEEFSEKKEYANAFINNSHEFLKSDNKTNSISNNFEIINEDLGVSKSLYLFDDDYSVPINVTNEDIIGIKSKKIEMKIKYHDDIKDNMKAHKIKNKKLNLNSEKNLHTFCMLTDKNADILPNNLSNVTRKFHCKSRYKKFNHSDVKSEETQIEDTINAKQNCLDDIDRINKASQRVLNSLKKCSDTNISKIKLRNDSDDGNKIEEPFIFEGKKIKITNVSDNGNGLYLFYPAPPKMMIKTAAVMKKLFPLYKSLSYNENNNIVKTDQFIFKYRNENENLDDKMQDMYDELSSHTALVHEKILSRQYHSDSELDKDNYSEKLKYKLRTSESLILFNENKNFSIQIDSNYNDAIEEAYFQKHRLSFGNVKNLDNINQGNLIESKDKELKKNLIDTNTSKRQNKYFLKNSEKTAAELSLEKGREYIESKITFLKKKSINENKTQTSLKLINELDKFMRNLNNKNIIHRTSSINSIKFPKKVPKESEFHIPRYIKRKKRLSLPNTLNFEEFLINYNYKSESKNDREWIRQIWNSWFEEVLPKTQNENKEQNEINEAELNNYVEAYTDNIVKSNEKNNNSQNKLFFDLNPHIELIIESESSEAKVIIEIKKEIDYLTNSIEEKSNAFSLTKRGALYRKLGFIKLAFNDLNQAIKLENGYVDAYWHRHLIYLVSNELDKAIDDLNTILKINKNHAGAYLSRGNIFAELNDQSMAIVNYSQAIKFSPNEYQAYYKRAKMYEARGDIRMAMDDYLTTTKLNPKIVDAWFKHGMNYYNNKNWQYAIVDFTELLKHNPNQAEARLYRGKCYLYLKDYQMAINDFSVSIHLNPKNWQAYYHRGSLLRNLSKQQSLRDLSISIMIESTYDNINSYLHRAILYYENQNFEEAIKDYENVLLLDKEFAPAYVNLGIIYMNIMSNYWKAIKCFNLAIRSNPIYIRAYLCRAKAFLKIHNLKQAYLDYSKVLHMNPMNTEVYIYRGKTILEMRNYKLAAFCVQHAAFLNEGNSEVLKEDDLPIDDAKRTEDKSITQKAVVYAFLKNFQKAFDVLDKELKLKPDRKTFNLLGKILMDAKRWQEACDIFQKSISFIKLTQKKTSFNSIKNMKLNNDNDDDLVESYFMKGRCLMELLKFNEAIHCFQIVLDMQPSNHEAFYYRGLVRAYSQQPNCVQDFNKALAINSNFFEAYLARAAIYGIENRYAKAILNCNEALKLNSKCVRGFLYRGALKLLSKSYIFAINDFTNAIKLNETCTLAYYNRALANEKLKNYSLALKDYSIVLLLGDYLKFNVCINRGLLYYNLRDYANALHDFKYASEFSPSDYKIKHIIGLCYHKLGFLDSAIEVLTNTIRMNKNYNSALVSRGNVYVDYGNDLGFKKAYCDYAQVLFKNPVDHDARINLAYLLQMKNRHKDSWRLLTGLITLHPNSSTSFEGRAIVCLQMSDTNAALKDINQAIKLNKSAEHFVNRGVIYQFIGDNINAMRDYQAALVIDPNCSLAHYNTANIYLLHKQCKQALLSYNNAVEKGMMKDETVYQNRGITKILMNNDCDAIKDFTEAIKYNKYAAHIYFNRGLLFYKMNDFKNAETDFTMAINLKTDDPIFYELRGKCKRKLCKNSEAINDFTTGIQLREKFQ